MIVDCIKQQYTFRTPGASQLSYLGQAFYFCRTEGSKHWAYYLPVIVKFRQVIVNSNCNGKLSEFIANYFMEVG